MIHAYSESYLSDASRCLAHVFDYALNFCGLEPDDFGRTFAFSSEAGQFERGNPAYLSGKSGEELSMMILSKAYPSLKLPKPFFGERRSEAYWAGWALAQYQWWSAKKFKEILSKVPLSEILSMYLVFHEMDVSRFNESMEERIKARQGETKLASIRESRGLSQAKLASISGVNLRSIQLYEQKVNDIDKAQGQALFKLSLVLGCSIEDLLENPSEAK